MQLTDCVDVPIFVPVGVPIPEYSSHIPIIYLDRGINLFVSRDTVERVPEIMRNGNYWVVLPHSHYFSEADFAENSKNSYVDYSYLDGLQYVS